VHLSRSIMRSLVSTQRSALHKTFSANIANKFLLVLMTPDVRHQNGFRRKWLSTKFARELSYGRVSTSMISQIAFRRESFLTNFALIRSNSRVPSHVVFQSELSNESGSAFCANERPFVQMCLLMFVQLWFCSELFSTFIASEHVSLVYFRVRVERRFRLQDFTALLAFDGVRSVHHRMPLEHRTREKRFTAVVAFEFRSLGRMSRQLVITELRVVQEYFPALFTLRYLFTSVHFLVPKQMKASRKMFSTCFALVFYYSAMFLNVASFAIGSSNATHTLRTSVVVSHHRW